jgi:hypothetical protein
MSHISVTENLYPTVGVLQRKKFHVRQDGPEGIVSALRAYRSGPSRDWIKVKNLDSPAMVRHREDRW